MTLAQQFGYPSLADYPHLSEMVAAKFRRQANILPLSPAMQRLADRYRRAAEYLMSRIAR